MKKFSYLQLVVLIGFQILLFFAFKARWIEVYELGWSRETVIRLNMPSDEPSHDSYIKSFSGPDILNEWKTTKKKFVTIDLTGDTKEDEKRIDLITLEARRLKYEHDTTSVIRVHINEENTYGQFVQLVNTMLKDRQKRYFLYKDDFYILGESLPDAE